MKKRNLFVVFVNFLAMGGIISSLILFSCAVPAMAQSPKAGLPKTLILAGPPTAGTNFILAVGFANHIRKHTGISVSVEPTAGGVGQAELIFRGAANISQIVDWDAYCAYNGFDAFAKIGKVDIILLQQGRKYQSGVLVRKDSPYKSIKDLRGKKIWALVPGDLSWEKQARAVFAAEGLDPDKDITLLKAVGAAEMYKNLAEGRGDAVCCAIGGARDIDFHATVGGRRLGLSEWGPEALRRARKEYPICSIGSFKAMPIAGVEKDLVTVAYGNSLMISGKHSDELAYTLVSAILEHHDELIPVHEWMKEWNLDAAVKNPVLPYHPGAIKYYKEKGVWTAELDKVQEQIIKNRGKK